MSLIACCVMSFAFVAKIACSNNWEVLPCKANNEVADVWLCLQTAATKAMKEVCAVVGNRDIEPFIPSMVSCIARPTEVPDCVHKLGATTFVQSVEAPALAIMTPLLIRGLKERATAVKRKSALIIDNMAKVCTCLSCLFPDLMADRCAWDICYHVYVV